MKPMIVRHNLTSSEDPTGFSYNGTLNTTRRGHTCQKWNVDQPHVSSISKWFNEDHNYCRNPDNEDFPWCYTTDSFIRWDFWHVSHFGM